MYLVQYYTQKTGVVSISNLSWCLFGPTERGVGAPFLLATLSIGMKHSCYTKKEGIKASSWHLFTKWKVITKLDKISFLRGIFGLCKNETWRNMVPLLAWIVLTQACITLATFPSISVLISTTKTGLKCQAVKQKQHTQPALGHQVPHPHFLQFCRCKTPTESPTPQMSVTGS